MPNGTTRVPEFPGFNYNKPVGLSRKHNGCFYFTWDLLCRGRTVREIADGWQCRVGIAQRQS